MCYNWTMTAMKKLVYLILATGLLASLVSCGVFQSAKVKTLVIESYKTQCTMPSYPFKQTLCMVIKEGEQGQPELITGIGGFKFEWGNVYEIVIKETKPPPNLADAPPFFRELVEVVSKEKVAPGNPFQMRLETIDPDSQRDPSINPHIIVQKAADLFEFFGQADYYDGREFTCVSPELCEEISGLIMQKLELTVEFAHPESPEQPLIAQRVVSTKNLPEWY